MRIVYRGSFIVDRLSWIVDRVSYIAEQRAKTEYDKR
jgi:hypothetical protein